jgi:hypothetical protein
MSHISLINYRRHKFAVLLIAFSEYCYDDQISQEEMGIVSGNMKERDEFGDLDIDGMLVILIGMLSE